MKTLLLTTLFSLNAAASVNMKDASFSKTWVDFADLHRTYNSRSLHNGIFGFGWCSDFEKNLRFAKNQVFLNSCSQEDEIPLPQIERIKDRLYFQQMVFDLSGRLLEYTTPDQQRASLDYDSQGLLRKVSLNGKHIFHLKYLTGTRQVQEITDSRGLHSYYTYRAQDLVEVKNSWKSVYRMTYDEVHNLTQVLYPDRTRERMTYDKDHDWITAYTSRQDCKEKYSFAQESDHMLATLGRHCLGQAPTVARYEFWNALNPQGQNYLQRIKITEGSLVTEVHYDALTGLARATHRQTPMRVAASQSEGKNL